jgi:hypothetical protein
VRTLLLACFGLVTHIATFTVHVVGSWKLKRLLIFCAGIMSRQLLACASCVACDSPREMEIPKVLDAETCSWIGGDTICIQLGDILDRGHHELACLELLARLSQQAPVSYHVPHQSQVNTQSSGLSPRTPSLLENPLTFFTNTRHPSQRYHLSFSTKRDCIFSRNIVVNIDVAPRLPVRHIIT